MINSLIERNRRLIRGVMQNVQAGARAGSDEVVADAIKLANRENDWEQIHDKMKSRYARSIAKVDGSSDVSASGWETIVRGDVATAINNGFYETVSTGFCSSVVRAHATLFNADDQQWNWTTGEGDAEKKSDDVSAIITEHRHNGQFSNVMEGIDSVASNVESCFLHMYFQGVDLHYDVVYPQDIYFMPCQTITEKVDGKEINRAANLSDIEDYAGIVIRLASAGSKGDYDSSADQDQFLAYVGRSEENPLGRRVIYQARDWKSLPEPGSKNIIEENDSDAGKRCNPLSRLVHDQSYGRYEYPIVPIRGGHMAVSKDVRPISTSLYMSSLELDLNWSKILKETSFGVGGAKVLTIKQGLPIPDSLDTMVLHDGDFKNVSSPASMQHVEMHQSVVKAVSGGFSVPGWQIIGQLPNMSTPPSGVSLMIESQSMLNFRKHKIRVNQDSVAKIYELEKALLIEGGVLGKNGSERQFEGVRQEWKPGTINIPKDETTRIAEIKAALDAELIDLTEAIKLYHKLDTDEQAQELYDKYSERDDQYDKPTQSNSNPFGGGF